MPSYYLIYRRKQVSFYTFVNSSVCEDFCLKYYKKKKGDITEEVSVALTYSPQH